MANDTSRPPALTAPFADTGDKNTIVNKSVDPDSISFELGWTPPYATPVGQPGWKAVERLDANGVFFQITDDLIYNLKGAPPNFDTEARFTDFINGDATNPAAGGFPLGATIGYQGTVYISAEENNNTVPNYAAAIAPNALENTPPWIKAPWSYVTVGAGGNFRVIFEAQNNYIGQNLYLISDWTDPLLTDYVTFFNKGQGGSGSQATWKGANNTTSRFFELRLPNVDNSASPPRPSVNWVIGGGTTSGQEDLAYIGDLDPLISQIQGLQNQIDALTNRIDNIHNIDVINFNGGNIPESNVGDRTFITNFTVPGGYRLGNYFASFNEGANLNTFCERIDNTDEYSFFVVNQNDDPISYPDGQLIVTYVEENTVS